MNPPVLDETAGVSFDFAGGMPNVNPVVVLFSVLLVAKASALSSSSFLEPAAPPNPNVNFEALLVPKLNCGTLSLTT